MFESSFAFPVLFHWLICLLLCQLLLSVQFSCSVVSDSSWPHGLQHTRLPCPSPTPRACSNSCPLSWWCHQTFSSSAIPFFSCLQSFPTSKSFPMSQLFPRGGQSTGVSGLASFLPKKSQGWSLSEWTGWISLQSKGLSRVFSNTTVKHRITGRQIFLSIFQGVHSILYCIVSDKSSLILVHFPT